MKQIPLTQGKFALVDDEDFERINSHKWSLGNVGRNNLYAIRSVYKNGKKEKTVYMHREVLELTSKKHVDHVNSNGLDNQKANLRECTHSENMRNRIRHNKSGFKGVFQMGNRWKAMIRNRYLGLFTTAIDAARAYNAAAKQLYGEFARLNEIPNE